MALFAIDTGSYAQSNHILNPAILQVVFEVQQGLDKDCYNLRCGKGASQYFSVSKYRNDSLTASPDLSISTIPLYESIEAIKHKDDPPKRLPSSPGHNDYLYWNLSNGQISIYTSVFGNKYVVEEEIPVMEWLIDEGSVRTILGYECHKAETVFRGRKWSVWYSDDIPISLGPWKLNGLPGIILQAECDGYMKMIACSITTRNLSPVTFYNFADYKFEPIERRKLLKMKTNPNSYPTNTIITPPMELE